MQRTRGEKIYGIFNGSILTLLALMCLLPFIHVWAVSFSSKNAVMSGFVLLKPVNFTTTAYQYVLERRQFWDAFSVAVRRVLIGCSINMILTITLAYPLSKESSRFFGRTAYVWVFFFTMLFGGGLIPTYTLIKDLKMLDTVWALVLPGAVPVFNVVLMLNFFRQVPSELEEAAYIDGAGHLRTLWSVYIPISVPSIATMVLFSVVGHWNAWFDGLIYMNHTSNYPLQSYLQTVIISFTQTTDLNMMDWKRMEMLCERNLKSAQIIVGTVPILMVYPFLQRFFVTGIVLGSVKG
jgi:putative aldouronate transport system permease protein